MKDKNTKFEILRAGAELIHKKGFNNTGLKDILDASGVPKGSFYHYFKSKDDFGLQVIDYFSGFFEAWLGELIEDPALPPLQRLRRFFAETRAYFERNGFEGGCPMGNLTQELGCLSEEFRQKIGSVFEGMRAGVARCLAEAIKEGQLEPGVDVEATAQFILASWEGALILMKVARSAEPHLNFERMIFDNLLARKAG